MQSGHKKGGSHFSALHGLAVTFEERAVFVKRLVSSKMYNSTKDFHIVGAAV